MSLLNEALRKNKSENSKKSNFDFSSQDTSGSGRKKLIILILCVVLTGGFIFAWIYFSNDSMESGIIKVQTSFDDDIPAEEQISGPVVSEPVLSEEISKENKDNTVLTEKKIVNKVSVESTEPVSIPPMPGIYEVQDVKKKEEKTPEILKTEITEGEITYYRKAVEFHKQGRLEKAISMYRKVLSYNSEHFDVLFNLASIYIKMSRYSDAYNILIKLLSGNPDDFKIILNLAVAEIGLEKNRDALFRLNGINEEGSELQFRVLFHKGVALSHLEEKDKALVCYIKAETLNPDNSALLLNIAVLYDKLCDYSKAIEYYMKLINSDSLDSHKKDKFKQRIEILRNSFSRFPVKNIPGEALQEA